MSTKIRLQRKGRKRRAFYSIVVANSRSPRDGKFIEKLGIYNPNTNPPTVNLRIDSALFWLQKGAQPSNTIHSILSNNGVLLNKHLLDGLKKGLFSENEVESRIKNWKKSKMQK